MRAPGEPRHTSLHAVHVPDTSISSRSTTDRTKGEWKFEKASFGPSPVEEHQHETPLAISQVDKDLFEIAQLTQTSYSNGGM